MSTITTTPGKAPVLTLSDADRAFYRENGYLIVKGLWKPEEVRAMHERFDELTKVPKTIENTWYPNADPATWSDPLQRYPRYMMPHRVDESSKAWMLDRRIHDVIAGLLEEEPIATQSMFYFKPPGAKGQALHQDDFYLLTKPGRCVAAWTAVDRASPENGGLFVVPRSHTLDIFCPEKADPNESFVEQLVRPPAGMEAIPAVLEPGDVLFFNGAVIHGSLPNRHASMWRRSFICHYIPSSATEISHFYFPLLGFDGQVIERKASASGGPCGTEWAGGRE